MRNYRHTECDGAGQLINLLPNELRGQLELGTVVTRYIDVPIPQVLHIRVLDLFEYLAIPEEERDDLTLYLVRG